MQAANRLNAHSESLSVEDHFTLLEKQLYNGRADDFDNDSPRLSMNVIFHQTNKDLTATCKARLEQVVKLEKFINLLNLPKHFKVFLHEAKQLLVGLPNARKPQKYVDKAGFQINSIGDLFKPTEDQRDGLVQGFLLNYKSQLIYAKFCDGYLQNYEAQILYAEGQFYK